MNNNICKQCNKTFNYYILKELLDTENEYCILHCDKSNWSNLKDKEFKFRYDIFWDEINNIILKNNERNDLIREHGEAHYVMAPYVFENINFSFFNFKKLGNSSYTTYTPDGDENGIYNIFNGLEPNIDIIFNNCIFEEEIDFTSLRFANNITFKETCNLKKGINFSNNSFTHNITVKAVNNIDINCKNTIFDKYIDFSNLKINSLLLSNTTFNENINLMESTLSLPLDLTNTIIKSNINFLNFKSEVANRQTARILKNEFDKQGDIIEANIFYAKEMKMREIELSPSKNFFDWIVFKVHNISSKHSQDWLLPLLWILVISIMYTHLQFFTLNIKNELNTLPMVVNLLLLIILIFDLKKLERITIVVFSYLIYGAITKDWTLYCVSNNINPFSIMTGEEKLTSHLLIYKIIIAYLIYQLVISIRQNTKRK